MKRVRLSGSLLAFPGLGEDTAFKGLPKGDDTWVYHMYRYQKTSVYASPHEKLPLMMRDTIRALKVVITVSLGGEILICIDALDPNETFTQDHFISFVLPIPRRHAQHLHKQKDSIDWPRT
jgi:hypothetical protein